MKFGSELSLNCYIRKLNRQQTPFGKAFGLYRRSCSGTFGMHSTWLEAKVLLFQFVAFCLSTDHKANIKKLLQTCQIYNIQSYKYTSIYVWIYIWYIESLPLAILKLIPELFKVYILLRETYVQLSSLLSSSWKLRQIPRAAYVADLLFISAEFCSYSQTHS